MAGGAYFGSSDRRGRRWFRQRHIGFRVYLFRCSTTQVWSDALTVEEITIGVRIGSQWIGHTKLRQIWTDNEEG